MTTKKLFEIMYFFMAPLLVSAQVTPCYQIKFEFRQHSLRLDSSYVSNQNDSLQISQLKLYLSHPRFINADGTSMNFEKSYTLLDAAHANILCLPLPTNSKSTPEFFEFSLGVDALPNTQGALADDLDVQNGMYWAWQSGYINFKIEGTCRQCATRKNQFAFHIGGYKNPNNALRTLRLPIPNQTKNILHIDVSYFFDSLALTETNTIQVPGEAAMRIADLFVKSFWIE